MKRIKTDYPGVYYREVERIGGNGLEKMFYVVFKKDGKVYEEKVGGQYRNAMTPARAAKVRADRIEGRRQSRQEIRKEAVKAKEAEAAKWTVARLWQEYIKTKELKGIAQDKSRFEKYLNPSFGEHEPETITPLEVDRFRLRILKGKSPQTVKLTLALLRRIIGFGVKRRLCKPLPFILEMPRVNNITTEDLTQEKLTKLLEVIDSEFFFNVAAQMMKLILFSGLRKGELFRLQWQDIDERGFIHIRGPKGGVDQKIPLSAGAKATLDIIPRGESPFVFPGRAGKQRTEARRGANRIKRLAEIPADFRPFHGLRHVYASMLASSGKVDLFTLAKLLTHKSTEMTKRYAHLRDETLTAAANVASDIIAQAGAPKGKAELTTIK